VNDRVPVKIRAGVGHVFGGRDGSVAGDEWDAFGDDPEATIQVRIKDHPATVKAARWQLEVEGYDNFPASEPEVLPKPPTLAGNVEMTDVQEAVMQAFLGRPEDPNKLPPAAHQTPAELAAKIVTTTDGGEVRFYHAGVSILFLPFESIATSAAVLRGLLVDIIEQARADGAATAGPGGVELGVRQAETQAQLQQLHDHVVGREAELDEFVERVDSKLARLGAGLKMTKERVDGLEGRCAQLERRSDG